MEAVVVIVKAELPQAPHTILHIISTNTGAQVIYMYMYGIVQLTAIATKPIH